MKAVVKKHSLVNSLAYTIIIVAAALIGLFIVSKIVGAAPAPKYFVCKYVGTPGQNETLQTGQNPISVSGNALPDGTNVGDSFTDQHGRSYVIALDTGQDEPTCPVPENEEPPEECPDGTVNIGTEQEPICRDEPTGCPNGDSIPVDSPKCEEEEEEETPAPQVEETPAVLPTFQGK